MTQVPAKFVDVATVQERLDNHSALESKLSADPADAAAAAQLELAYQEQGRHEDLLQLLLTRAETVPGNEERVELLRRASRICVDSEDKDSALLILLTAFELAPDNLELANEVDQLGYQTGNWEEVLHAYQAAAEHNIDPQLTGSFWLRIACVHATSLDIDAVQEALHHIESVDVPWSQDYLDLVERQAQQLEIVVALAELCARIQDFPRRARCLTRAIAMSESLPEKANLHSELANLYLMSDDRVAANWHLREALRLDPERHDCQAALIAMSKEEGDLRAAADMLCAQALAGTDDRSTAAFEAAKLYSELEENTKRFDLLTLTINEDPRHLGAALPLSERYYAKERWAELEPLLALLLDNLQALPEKACSATELYFRAGCCAEALGHNERARDYYAQVLTLEGEHLEALAAYALVLTQLQETDAAFDVYQSLLSLQANAAGSIQSSILEKMANLRFLQAMPKEALTLAKQATLLDAGNCSAGRLRAKLHEEFDDFKGAVKARQGLMKHVDVATQVELHCEIANLRCWNLDDPIGAINEYKSALQKDAENRKVLHNLIDLYSASELWTEAVDVIRIIAGMATDPLIRGKYFDAAGEILRVKLEDEESIKCFNRALDCFFVEAPTFPESARSGYMRPFYHIVEFLHEQANYEQLERNYRKMIQRLPPEDAQVVQLWQELGQLYSGKLDRQEDAIASFEVVTTLDGSSNHKRVLLSLYEQNEGSLDNAIEQRESFVQKDPLNAENYSALTELFLRSGEHERAWNATRALVFLNKANEAQKTYYYQQQPREMCWPRMPVANEMWQHIRHPDEQPLVGAIFTLIADVLVMDCAVDEAGLLARDGNTLLHEELRALVRGVAYVMGMSSVRVTVDLDLNADLLFLPTTAGPAFVAGRFLWQAPSIRARVHAIARSLARARPDAQLQALATSNEHLESLLMGAITFSRPDLAVSPHLASQMPAIHQILEHRLPQPRRVRLAHAVQSLVISGVRHDISAWNNAVQCTGHRIALLLAGDLQLIPAICTATGEDTDRILADLLAFSIGKAHADMRRDLGIAAVPSA